MIQTRIPDGKGGYEELNHHDPRYWEGPYRYEPYPKALYRQTQPGQAPEVQIVKSADEHDRLGSDWKESPADAKAAFEALEADIAKAAAERNYTDRRMSEKAQYEALIADRATDEVLGAIPERKKPGRKPKTPIPSV